MQLIRAVYDQSITQSKGGSSIHSKLCKNYSLSRLYVTERVNSESFKLIGNTKTSNGEK
jgi:hypothetical protein